MSTRTNRERRAPQRFEASSHQPSKHPSNHSMSASSTRTAANSGTRKRKYEKASPELGEEQGKLSALVSETVWGTFVQICRKYAERPALGTKKFDSDQQGTYDWITYSQLLARVDGFASGLAAIVPEGAAVGICAPNVVDWVVADWACIRAGLFSVPIHLSRAQDAEGLRVISQETRLHTVVCSSEACNAFTAASCGIQMLVMIGSSSPMQTAGTPRVIGFETVVSDGQLKELDAAGLQNQPDSKITLFFSSGTTGRPKAVSLSERELLEDLREVAAEEDGSNASPPVQLAIYSFAYSLERDNSQTVFLLGGQLALFRGEMNHVFSELWTMQPKPTTILGVPALWNALFQLYELEVETHIRTSMCSYVEAQTRTQAEFASKFGQQLAVVSSGTAPLTPSVRAFMKSLFPDAFIGEGYGLQETGLITLENEIQRGVSVKLRDLPALGYTSKDKPWPRGEICVKTPTMISKYELPPEGWDSKALLIEDGGVLQGYFATGDIGELRGHGGGKGTAGQRRRGQGKRRKQAPRLFVIDRVKTLFKLSNGEFVSPVALEHTYSESPLVHQIMIHGKPSDDQVVAVVVPDVRQIPLHLTSTAHGSTDSSEHNRPAIPDVPDSTNAAEIENFCAAHRSAIEALLLQELRSLARYRGLRAHECVVRVHLATPHANPADASEGIGWSALNGALTPSLKLNRPHVTAQFRNLLDCVNTDKSKGAALQQLVPPGTADSTLLRQLGLHSLSAFRFASALGVPLELLLSTHTTAGDLRAAVAGSLSGERSLATEEDLMRADLNQLGTDLATVAASNPCGARRSTPQQPETGPLFFVTGATGFLGSVITLELLSQFPAGSVVCLVRSDDGEQSGARLRLEAVLRDTGLWQAGFESRLQVLVGSADAPNLGLSDSWWAWLVDRRPVVVHSAAQVSWVSPYSALRCTNVLGTVEVLRLCLHCQPSLPLIHISTGAAAACTLTARSPSPSSVPPGLLSEVSGYVASKMVAEALVNAAVQHHALPALVFRPGSVAPHSQTGFANRHDFFCRYLSSCRQLRLCVDSAALCELIPVDVVARCVVDAGIRRTLNVARTGRPRQLDHSVLAIANASSPTFTQLGGLLQSAWEGGCRFRMPREFASDIRAAASSPLHPLLPLLESDAFWEDGPHDLDPCLELRHALREGREHGDVQADRRGAGGMEGGLAFPVIDAAYLQRVLARLGW